MKVLLIAVNTQNSTAPPLGLYMLKTYYEQYSKTHLCEIKILFFQAPNFIKIFKEIKDEKPDVIGYSCFVWNFNQFIKLNELVKKSLNTISIFGGPSISFDDHLLEEQVKNGNIDYLIINQGEHPFYQLLQHIENYNSHSLDLINGIVYRDAEGQLIKNRDILRNTVDLNEVNNPYLVDQELRKNAKDYHIVYYEMSRGCPYSCSYCYEANMPFSSKDIDLIIEELDQFKLLGFKEISVLDATLNFNIKRTKTLLSKIIAKNYNFSFFFEIKAEHLDDELIDMLAKAGVKGIEVGLQSSSLKTLKLINRYFDKVKFETNIQKLIKKDFLLIIDLIIGLPNEGVDDLLNSIEYCYNLGNVKISINPLKVLPNTALYNQIEQFDYKFDTNNMNQIVSSSTMTGLDLHYTYRISHIVLSFWSSEIENKEYVKKIREICGQYFDSKLTPFIKVMENYIYKAKLEKKTNVSSAIKLDMIKQALSNVEEI